jgi:CRISPR type I-F-associated protein Csy2
MLISIDFEDNDDLDFDLDESDFSLFSFEDNIQEALYTLRVAGGEIENTDSFLSIVNNDENLLSELKNLDRGFFISDAQDKLDEYTELFEGDVLRAIIHMSALFEKEDSSSEKYDAKGWERASEGWLTPTNIGYVQINSQPIEGNEGARDIHPLYYVEPLTSMVEYIYSNRILRKVTDDVMSSLIENKVVFTSVFKDNTYKIISKGE